MQQFDVKRGSRKCCVTEHPFGAGEVFYSALIETSSGTMRSDFCIEAWEKSPWSQQDSPEPRTPVENAPSTDSNSESSNSETLIGWWKQRVPEQDSGVVYWAPDHVLIAWFDSLYASQSEKTQTQQENQQETAWVMALLLLQKRLLTRNDRETDSDILHLINKKTNQEYELQEPVIDEERIDCIQNHLAENLFSDRPL